MQVTVSKNNTPIRMYIIVCSVCRSFCAIQAWRELTLAFSSSKKWRVFVWCCCFLLMTLSLRSFVAHLKWTFITFYSCLLKVKLLEIKWKLALYDYGYYYTLPGPVNDKSLLWCNRRDLMKVILISNNFYCCYLKQQLY